MVRSVTAHWLTDSLTGTNPRDASASKSRNCAPGKKASDGHELLAKLAFDVNWFKSEMFYNCKQCAMCRQLVQSSISFNAMRRGVEGPGTGVSTWSVCPWAHTCHPWASITLATAAHCFPALSGLTFGIGKFLTATFLHFEKLDWALMPRMPKMSWGPTPPSHCWSGRWPLSIYRTVVLSQNFHRPYFLCSCACFERLEFRTIIRNDCWLNLCLLQVPWVSSCCNAAVIEIHSMLWHQGVGWGSSQNKKWCRLLMKSLAALIHWNHFKLKPFIMELYCTEIIQTWFIIYVQDWRQDSMDCFF